MTVRPIAPIFLALCLLLSGCSSLLEREYHKTEPHSSKFWESEAAGTLRAENYQDIVNDLLILIGQHTESATVRLYYDGDEMTVADTLETAAAEIQQETPMGAYAVEYIASFSQAQRGYYEISIQIGYRRTAEQIQSVVNATSVEALYALLDNALTEERTELAVRVGYWVDNGRERVDTIVEQIRQDHGLTESAPWAVIYYPAEGPVGLVEFIMDPEQALDGATPAQGETPSGDTAILEEEAGASNNTPLREDTLEEATVGPDLSDGQEALLSDEPS